MEAIIILVIIAIIGYFIYQSLPNTKFEKAENIFNANDYNGAAAILSGIFDKHIDAPAKLAECKLRLGQIASNNKDKILIFKEVTALRNKISNSTSITKFDIIEAKALLEIAKIQYEETEGDIEKLIQNIKFIDSANKRESESDFTALKSKHYHDLANSQYKKGNENEKSGHLPESIQSYIAAKDYSEKAKNKTIQTNSTVRMAICQLKLNEKISLSIIPEISESEKDFQIELYYRYAIKLLKNKDFLEAEKIINTHLNFKSSDIDKLIDIINAEKINNVVKRVEDINISIERLYNNSLSVEELKTLYSNIDKSIYEVGIIDKPLSERISSIKPTLFNRLLSNYISEEQYSNGINLIQQYPKFWKSHELLKNLGLCCYGLTSNGLLTEENFRIVISGWLTAVFSDKVILKSLENTSWDDNYTFTLSEAIGSNYSQIQEMPQNVNYDELSDTNISIGATQRELLQQYETIIHRENSAASISKLVIDFYDKEKEAIAKIIEVIENDILFSTPYFATTFGLNNEIIKELDNDYKKYSSENALEAGIPYIKDSNSTIVYQYFYANDLIERVLGAIKIKNSAAIKNLNTKENKRWLVKFNDISNKVEDKLFNLLSKIISDDDENENIISIMEECIAFSISNERLKHQYSNYIANYCITKVNDEKIDHFKALSLMKNAYLQSPNNPKICKNFITLIKFNLMDMLNDRTRNATEIYTILDWVKNNKSQIYKQNSSDLSNERNEILQQLRKGGVDTSLLDDGSRTMLLPLGQSLNADGLKMKKVLTYLKDLGNEPEVTNPFDRFNPLRFL